MCCARADANTYFPRVPPLNTVSVEPIPSFLCVMYRASVFDIPRKPQHLKSGNEGTANAHYRQVTATRDVANRAFYQGVQQFRFEPSGNTWFIPAMSYFRLRCQLLQVREAGDNARPLLSGEDIAPNMGLAANLFKSAEVSLNGHTLERITERLPQIDALKTRMKNTGSWLDQVGKTTNFWEPDFDKRREQVCVDGYVGDRNCLADAEYGPWLTQRQAQFNPQHRLRYDRKTQIVEFDRNDMGVIDIRVGPMSLRPGDRLRHRELVLNVVSVVDSTHALVTCHDTGPDGNICVGEMDANDGDDGNNGDDDDDGDDDSSSHAIDDDDIQDAHGVSGWEFQKLSSAVNNEARGQSTFEIIWRPPLGFFDVEHAIPPGGDWVFAFNPVNAMDAQKNVVESLLQDLSCANPDNGAQLQSGSFNFAVKDFFFYAYTIESDRFDHGDWLLDLQNTRCQLQNMPNNAMSLTQKTFDVPGKTSSLTLAFQDQGPTSDTRYSQSKFKIRPAPVDESGTLSTQEGQDLLLERFFIQYGNEQKPVPDFDGAYSKALSNSFRRTENFLVHRYVDSLMQTNLFHTDGGAETYDDWIRRGPYYHFRWPKDAMENSTRVTVNFKFSQRFAENLEHQVMLFSQWRTAYKITHRNGRIHLPSLEEL